MDITRFAIEKNRITITMLLVLILAGVGAYLSMPRSEDPGFTIRTAQVQTFFPGAGPERVELLVSDKLEKVIQQIPELDVVYSESKTGISVIYVDIRKNYKDMRPIWDNLRRKVDDARPELPDTIQGPFVNDEFGDVYGIQYVLTGDGFEYRQLNEIAKEVRNELLLLSDVAKVQLYGKQEERVFVEYNNARLAEFGLSPVQLQKILEERNIILPGGDVRLEYEQIFMEPSGNFDSLEDIKRSVINLPGSKAVVRLEDLVTVTRGYIDPPNTIMHSRGEPCMGIAVSMREGGNILDMGKAVDAVIERSRSVYPIGIEIESILDQAKVVEKKINDFVGSLYQAVAIVAAIMLLFLGLRTGLIVSSLIPTTMIATFFVMSIFDIGLDQMSLASLIIALGMLVDNAIVMSESIMVQMERGKAVKEAAIDSARELKIPLLTSSLTTSAAFLPIFLAEAEMGEYTASLFTVVTMTLLVSWTMALTLIPVLCVLFMKVKTKEPESQSGGGEFDSKGYRLYRQALLTLVRHPLLSLAGVIGLFFIALQGFKFVPNIFMPANDRPTMTIELELPQGSPIERSTKVVAGIESFMMKNLMAEGNRPGLVNWGAFIGSGAPKFQLPYSPEAPSPGYSILIANATDVETIQNTIIPGVENFISESYPDVKPTLRPLPLGSPAWPPVAVRVSGRDTDKLFDIVDEVKAKVRSISGTKQISDDWGTRAKKVTWKIDETRARLAGVSNKDVAISMQTYLSGLETTEYRERDELIPVVMRSTTEQRLDLERIANMGVYSQATGESVPLIQVATPELQWEPSIIHRRQRLRTVTVEALLDPGTTASEVNSVLQPWLEDQQQKWPFGFNWEFGGEAETSDVSKKAIGAKLPVAGLIIVLLLIGQFNSFRRGAIIMLTIPLAIIGVVIGLLITGLPFNFMALLGIISLAGIVINNAIVLIDRIGIEINENGLEPNRAVIEAAQQRLRPILLTTLTTIGGMIPLWMGGGPMWEAMAVTIIFGILFATMLTLGVVPLLYSLFFSVKYADFKYSER
jgi:multidrug efflux pump